MLRDAGKRLTFFRSKINRSIVLSRPPENPVVPWHDYTGKQEADLLG